MGKKIKTRKTIQIPEVSEILQDSAPVTDEPIKQAVKIDFTEDPEDFNLQATSSSDFQDSLKEFYVESQDIPEEPQTNKYNVEKITTEQDKDLLTVKEFNNTYKQYVKNRNKVDSPQLYKQNSCDDNKETQYHKQDHSIYQTTNALTNRNNKVISNSSRNKKPTLKMNNKLSENR